MSASVERLPLSIRGSDNYSFHRVQFVGLLFVLPVVLGTLILNVLPTFATLGISFTSYDMLTAPEWVGLGNYERLLADEFAGQALRNTIVYTAGTVFLGIPAGLGLALLVNNPLPGIRLIRLAYIVPYVSSTVAIAMVWQWILNGKLGLLNQFLKMLGIEGQSWLTNPNIAMLSVIVVSVWQGLGYNMLLFLAGLQSIPEALYEAAKIDGGGARSRLWHITLPLLSPTTFFVLIITLISSFQVFSIIYIFTFTSGAAGRLRSLDVWVYYLWQNIFSFNRAGYAAAMAFGLFVVIAAVTYIQWRASKLWVFYGE
ncbi:MAG: sugar ABC transporter permease [Chloroflexi bacterium]|nr:sugar ABC transporter permease [Chloroflexota bacterium]